VAGVCSNASPWYYDIFLDGDENSTRQQCIDICAAQSGCRFVFYTHYSAGAGGGSAACNLSVSHPIIPAMQALTRLDRNNAQYDCTDIGARHSAGAIYDKVATTTSSV